MSWKKSLLVISKILGMFINTLTADEKYSVPKKDNLTQPIQMQLSKKQNVFLNLFLDSSNLDQIFNILKKMMIIIAYIVPKLQTAKDVVR